jgi:hypothetical protein
MAFLRLDLLGIASDRLWLRWRCLTGIVFCLSRFFSGVKYMRSLSVIALLVATMGMNTALAQVMSVESAQDQLRNACKAERGTDAETCDCYVDSLAQTLPKDDFEKMVVLAAIAISGDDEKMTQFVEEQELTYDVRNEMLLDTREALTAAEKSCGL